MTMLSTERRSHRARSSHARAPVDIDKLVRQAVLLQSSVGTRGAVEYLKNNRIGGDVIKRVLSGGAIRHEDLASRDLPSAWE